MEGSTQQQKKISFARAAEIGRLGAEAEKRSFGAATEKGNQSALVEK